MLEEVRFHGRGGQGAVTSSQVLAIAAFLDGNFSQAFPMFGVERRGAPVQSFCRIAKEKINIRSQIYEPDYVIVLDSTLIGSINVAKGLKKNGLIVINSDKTPKELNLAKDLNVKTIDVTKLALEVIGKPFVNIGILGAFSSITEKVSLKALQKAIAQRFEEKPKMAELNKKLAEKVFEECKKVKK